MAKLAALAAALLLCSPAALAWGGLAHEAICKVPFRELDDTARQRRATAGDSACQELQYGFHTLTGSTLWVSRDQRVTYVAIDPQAAARNQSPTLRSRRASRTPMYAGCLSNGLQR